MDCTRAQELTLDELDGVIEGADRVELRRHVAACAACRAFEALQQRLDAELRDGAPALALDAGFRRRIDARLSRPWLEWLPELAYAAGGVLATGACVVALPLPAASTWWIGGALAGLGLAVHSLVASALSGLDAGADS